MSSELWTRENLVWLAGLLEGEGYFAMEKQKAGRPNPTVQLMMADGDVIASVARIAGCGSLDGREPKGRHKRVYRWRTTNQYQAVALMYALLPFMHYRRALRIRSALREWRSNGRPGSWRVAA